jgi:phosphate transport system substrate-binding protein
MKNFILLIVILSGCYFMLNGCGDSNKVTPSFVTDSPDSGTINISVDESFKPVIENAIRVYEGTHLGTKINATYKTEAACFKDFYNDSTNRMVIVTRGLTKQESRYFTDSIGYTPVSDRIAWDAIAILTNKNNNDTVYTQNDLRQLLLGMQGNAKKVVFDGLNATSTVRFAIDSILKGAKFDTTVVKAVKNSKDVLNYIANNKDAVGLVGISWIGNAEDTAQVKMLQKLKIAYVECMKCDSTPYVKPTQASILSHRYPLVRGLYYIVKENFSGLGSGFASFLKYEKGQLLFRRAYLGPIMDFDVRDVQINEKF